MDTMIEQAAVRDLARTTGNLMLLNEDSDPDAFGESLSMLNAVAARVKELKDHWKAVALERVQKHGEMVIGPKRYYAGNPTVTKCKSVRDAAEAVFVATAGDWDAFVGCLASDAFKPGETRKTLGPENFLKVFTVENKAKLVEAEPRKRQLIEVDTRYVK